MRDNTEQSSSKAAGVNAGSAKATGLGLAKKKIAAGVGLAALATAGSLSYMRNSADEAAGRFFEQKSGTTQKLDNDGRPTDATQSSASGSSDQAVDAVPVVLKPEARVNFEPTRHTDRLLNSRVAVDGKHEERDTEQQYVKKINQDVFFTRSSIKILSERLLCIEILNKIKEQYPQYSMLSEADKAIFNVQERIYEVISYGFLERMMERERPGEYNVQRYYDQLTEYERKNLQEIIESTDLMAFIDESWQPILDKLDAQLHEERKAPLKKTSGSQLRTK